MTNKSQIIRTQLCLNNLHKDLMFLLNRIEIPLPLREQVNSQPYQPVLQSHIKNLLKM